MRMTSELNEVLGPPPAAYQAMRSPLEGLGWICQGTVVCRPLRRRIKGKWVEKGPYYLWTGKSEGKTICHALSQQQYEAAQKAIDANRRAVKALAQLQAMTLKEILNKVPGVKKRK
jgi:hypothetical protein